MFINFSSAFLSSVVILSFGFFSFSNAVEVSIQGGKIKVSADVEDSQDTNVGNNHDVNMGGVKIKDGAKVENTEISTEAEIHNVEITNTGEGKDIIIGGIEIGGD